MVDGGKNDMFVFVLGRGKLKAWCPSASSWRVHRARGCGGGGRWTKGSGPVWSDQLEVGVCAGSGEDGGRVRIKGVLGKGNNTRVGEVLRWWQCRGVVVRWRIGGFGILDLSLLLLLLSSSSRVLLTASDGGGKTHSSRSTRPKCQSWLTRASLSQFEKQRGGLISQIQSPFTFRRNSSSGNHPHRSHVASGPCTSRSSTSSTLRLSRQTKMATQAPKEIHL